MAAATALSDALDTWRWQAILDARGQTPPATWEEIGRALGVSPSKVREYCHRKDEIRALPVPTVAG
ncbi:hypothetical protein [Frankia sp. AiPa1]|uniref:hypothetical protein n=1 Tax=Frankia sp. AiPa1 TaxID=573492 RepID=UPI00202B66B9|nr:hypothetical protein [Frankia sp. AiPa1]